MTRPATFTQSDVTRALKAAIRAGIKPNRAEIEPSGKITLLFPRDDALDDDNEWDEVLDK